jgi:hypothetical protein
VKRPVVRITVTDAGTEVHRSIAHAWNSASRGAEAAIRTIARGEGQTYSRVADSRRGAVGEWMTYRWQGDRTGRELVTRIELMP